MSVSLASEPPSLGPGEPWTADLLVHGGPDLPAEATPGIQIQGPGGAERTFAATPTGKRAADGRLLYRVEVVFPIEGRWSYRLLDGVSERAYEGGSVRIGDAAAPAVAPEAPGPAAAPSEGSFPLWPVLAAALATVAAAAAAVALVRRSRLAATR